MKKNVYNFLSMMVILVLALSGCNTQPAQETQEAAASQGAQPEESPDTSASQAAAIPPENILFIASEGDYPIVLFILTMDYNTNSMRFANFFYQTQINAVTKEGEELSMPMGFLGHCDTPEIVKAYENTYGITIDRYLLFQYDLETVIKILNELSPITLNIPEEFLGDEEYSTINGNMQAYSEDFDIEPDPVDEAGEQELDSLGLFSFFHTIPDRVSASDDRGTNMMEDYRLWDEKNQTVIEAFKPLFKLLGEDGVSGLWELVTEGQDTDITEEDIAKWSKLLASLPDEKTPYFTVPGFEGVEVEDFDAKTLTGMSGFDVKMLVYDNETMAENLQKFINGQ